MAVVAGWNDIFPRKRFDFPLKTLRFSRKFVHFLQRMAGREGFCVGFLRSRWLQGSGGRAVFDELKRMRCGGVFSGWSGVRGSGVLDSHVSKSRHGAPGRDAMGGAVDADCGGGRAVSDELKRMKGWPVPQELVR